MSTASGLLLAKLRTLPEDLPQIFSVFVRFPFCLLRSPGDSRLRKASAVGTQEAESSRECESLLDVGMVLSASVLADQMFTSRKRGYPQIFNLVWRSGVSSNMLLPR